jgi:hypothetical protein
VGGNTRPTADLPDSRTRKRTHSSGWWTRHRPPGDAMVAAAWPLSAVAGLIPASLSLTLLIATLVLPSPPPYTPPHRPLPPPPPPPRRGAHAMSPPLVRRCPSWCWASPPSSSSTSAGSDACTRKSLQPSRLSPTSFLARSARRVDWFDVLDLGRRLERSAVSDAFFEDPNSLNKVLPDSSCRGRLGLCHVVHDRCLLISLCELL